MEEIQVDLSSLDWSHEFDDEFDTQVKTAIVAYLSNLTVTSAKDVAIEIDAIWRSQSEQYAYSLPGSILEVEDIFIFMSKFIPIGHPAANGLPELITAVRQLPSDPVRPNWSSIFPGNPPGSLVEAYNGLNSSRLSES